MISREVGIHPPDLDLPASSIQCAGIQSDESHFWSLPKLGVAGKRAAVEWVVMPGDELGKERRQITAKGEFLPAAQGLVRDEAFESFEPPRERLGLVAQPGIVFEQELHAALVGGIEHDHRREPDRFMQGVGQLHEADALALGFDEDGFLWVEPTQRRHERRIEGFLRGL